MLPGFSVGFETVKDWLACRSGRWKKMPNFRVEYFSFFLFIGKQCRKKQTPPLLAT